jgi:hypothetical protein
MRQSPLTFNRDRLYFAGVPCSHSGSGCIVRLPVDPRLDMMALEHFLDLYDTAHPFTDDWKQT